MHTLKKLYREVQSHIEFKVALNTSLEFFFFFNLQNVAPYHAGHSSKVKNKGVNELVFSCNHLQLKLGLFLAGYIVVIVTYKVTKKPKLVYQSVGIFFFFFLPLLYFI